MIRTEYLYRRNIKGSYFSDPPDKTAVPFCPLLLGHALPLSARTLGLLTSQFETKTSQTIDGI